MTTTTRRARLGRRTASIAVLLLLVAAPAAASIIVQNFMQAEITAADACFNKVGGNDPAGSPLAGYADEATVPLSTYTEVKDGVTLIGERVTLEGQKNDRVIFTDVVRYKNDCGTPIDVTLTAAEASGDWTALSAQVWISNSTTTDPADVDPNVDVVADDWNNTFITVPAGSSGVIAGTTGTVTVPIGGEIQGAFVVTTGETAPGGAVLNWIAEAVIPT